MAEKLPLYEGAIHGRKSQVDCGNPTPEIGQQGELPGMALEGFLEQFRQLPFVMALGSTDGAAVRFPIDAFARYCLLNGTDELDFLLARNAEIDAFERR